MATAFFYDNPLQRRTVQAAAAPGYGERARLVPVRLLPAEPDADARVVGAVPGHHGRLRDPGPPVRHRPTSPWTTDGRPGSARRSKPPIPGRARSGSGRLEAPDGPPGRSRCGSRLGARVDRHGRSREPGAGRGRYRPGRAATRTWQAGDADRPGARHGTPGHRAGPADRCRPGLCRPRTRAARLLHRDGGSPRRASNSRTSTWPRASARPRRPDLGETVVGLSARRSIGLTRAGVAVAEPEPAARSRAGPSRSGRSPTSPGRTVGRGDAGLDPGAAGRGDRRTDNRRACSPSGSIPIASSVSTTSPSPSRVPARPSSA